MNYLTSPNGHHGLSRDSFDPGTIINPMGLLYKFTSELAMDCEVGLHKVGCSGSRDDYIF
jgi:hypothetical protein